MESASEYQRLPDEGDEVKRALYSRACSLDGLLLTLWLQVSCCAGLRGVYVTGSACVRSRIRLTAEVCVKEGTRAVVVFLELYLHYLIGWFCRQTLAKGQQCAAFSPTAFSSFRGRSSFEERCV